MRSHTFFHRAMRYLLLGTTCGLLLIAACQGESPTSQPPSTPVASEDVPPPPPGSAFLGRLTPEQTAEIEALSLPLVLPSDIPGEFSVAQVITQPGDRFAGYQILYRSGGDRCFLIEYASGGVGGTPETDNRQPISPPILQNGAAEFGLNYGNYKDPALREQFPAASLMSDWLPVAGGFVRFAGAALINSTLQPSAPCQNVTVEEAIAIINSLAVITEGFFGDGVGQE